MRIHETARIPGVEYGTIQTGPGRNLRAIRVAPGPWLWAGETPASDEVSDDPIGEYWAEVVSMVTLAITDGCEAEEIADDDWDAPSMADARECTEGMVWEFTTWADTLTMVERWADESAQRYPVS